MRIAEEGRWRSVSVEVCLRSMAAAVSLTALQMPSSGSLPASEGVADVAAASAGRKIVAAEIASEKSSPKVFLVLKSAAAAAMPVLPADRSLSEVEGWVRQDEVDHLDAFEVVVHCHYLEDP